MRCLFSYDPVKDTLLPCTEIGLPFKYGDILQVVNSTDPSWWQARHELGDTIGLVPSQDLEERRKCFVERPDISTFSKWSSCCGTGVSISYDIKIHIKETFVSTTTTIKVYFSHLFFNFACSAIGIVIMSYIFGEFEGYDRSQLFREESSYMFTAFWFFYILQKRELKSFFNESRLV